VKKRKQNIIIGFISWASLLLLVLYSPIGSPDLYRPNYYYTRYQAVNFNSSGFAKRIKTNSNSGNKNNINVPTYSTQSNKRTSYSVNKNNYAKNNNYSLPMITNNNHLKNNSSTGSDETGFSGFSSNKLGSSSTNSSDFQNNNLISTSTDLSLLSDNNITRQGSTETDQLGTPTTDPGGDPFGPPIPVPDGWGFLLVLAGIYTVVKKYVLK